MTDAEWIESKVQEVITTAGDNDEKRRSLVESPDLYREAEARGPLLPFDLVRVVRWRVLYDVPSCSHPENERAALAVSTSDGLRAERPEPVSFDAWAAKQISEARERANELGITPELALLRSQWGFVNHIRDNYPEIGPAQGLFVLGLRVREDAQ